LTVIHPDIPLPQQWTIQARWSLILKLWGTETAMSGKSGLIFILALANKPEKIETNEKFKI
jgi:hypothetical protein